ncbi:DUF551 domain-containing protein [Klebsiella pneumoniae]|nr:DUF551 domain-containing protein [Klebsiella pneumoniae]
MENKTMTKSTITREESIQAVFDLKVGYTLGLADIEILKRVARMALVAMDSEPVEMPLDYLQGHKDGLEWASQLAEANHPETGDWLYDDPIELAKAIRKGPDMPPVQPVADSGPDRNPVLAYADSYRDMAKQGVESVPIWSVITDLERNIAPLYRHAQPVPEHPEVLPCSVLLEPGLRFGKGIKTSTMLAALARRAVYESDMAALSQEERAEFQARIEDFKALIAQPAPVVPDDVLDALQKVARIRLDLNEFDGDRRGIADCLCDAEEALIEVVNRRAAMLHAGNSPANPDGLPDGVNIYHGPKEKTILVLKQGVAVNQDCWCRTCRPVTLNDMRFVVCPDCGNKRCPRANDHRNACTGSNEPGQEGSAYPAAPQSPGSEPATVPGTWIPVSERLPEDSGRYWCYVEEQNDLGKSHYQWNCSWNGDRWWVESEGGGIVTHWMQLPAAPQEVNRE